MVIATRLTVQQFHRSLGRRAHVKLRLSPLDRRARGLHDAAVRPTARALAGVLLALALAACGGSSPNTTGGRGLIHVTMPNPGMAPTLNTGARVAIKPSRAAPALYQLVGFHPPTISNPAELVCTDTNQGPSLQEPCGKPAPREAKTIFVRRVVGLPGDRIAVVNGFVIRNGVKERVPKVAACPGVPECALPKAIVVPPGHYYLVGDNRGDSNDSRFWGPVPRPWIIGVVVR
jgi:signal peptidase I